MGKPFEDCPCGEPHIRGCKDHVRRCVGCEKATAHGLAVCPSCGGTEINEKSPCRKPAKDGAGACRTHGGTAPQIVAAVARREEEAQAVQILGKQGVDPVKHPVEELLDLVAIAKTLQRILGDRMDAATDLSSAEYQAWERSFDRFSKLLIDLSKLGLEGRKVAIDEARATLAGERIHAAINEWTTELKQQLPPPTHPQIDQALTLLPPLLRKHLTQG